MFLSQKRFKIAVTGRRVGKTVWQAAECAAKLFEGNDRQVAYIGPTWGDAKRLMYRPFLDWIYNLQKDQDTKILKDKSDSDLTLRFVNGSEFRINGGHSYDRLRGDPYHLITIDEGAYCKEEVWDTVFPCLADFQGKAIIGTTPAGYDWVFDKWQEAALDDDWEAFSFTTLEGGNVVPEEIAIARKNLSSEMFKQEYEASFLSLAGRVYKQFNFHEHLFDLQIDREKELHIGIDFNVNPMTAVIAQEVEDQLHILDEVYFNNSDTAEVAAAINNRYSGYRKNIYPDASGNARKTSAAGQTDFSLLLKAGFRVYAPSKNPPVKDRVNEVNALFHNAEGDYRLFIDKKCVNLVKALMGLTYNKAGEIDKTSGLDHITDALGYLVHSKFGMNMYQSGIKHWN
jgi:hypothetical protein